MLESLDITVHHLSAAADLTPPSPAILLDAGRRLIYAAIAPSGNWLSVSHTPADFVGSASGFPRKACFVWSRLPPLVIRDTVATVWDSDLEDWDAPFDEDAIDISTLPEFEGTDFSDVLQLTSGKRKSQSGSRSQSPARHFADDVDVNLDTHLTKRNWSQTDSHARARSLPSHIDISISTLIPLPHYHASPDPACPPPPEIDKIPAFRITCVLCPSTSFSQMPFARTAWIVPLRGRPPFAGASFGSIAASAPDILPTELEGHAETEAGTPPCIRWTPLAVTQFWEFLLRQRSVNNIGPIAFSYILSRLSAECTGDVRKGMWKGNARERGGKGNLRECGGEISEQGKERRWEYIKIYHDTRYAMKLRSLLDSFRWVADGGWGTTGYDELRRNRVLKGARLVLVDEIGDGVVLA